MIAIIFLVIFALMFAVFATQNTSDVSVSLWIYQFQTVPLYFVILATFALGFLFAALFYIVKSITSGVALWKSHGETEKIKKEKDTLTKRIHDLEMENAKLKVEKDGDTA